MNYRNVNDDFFKDWLLFREEELCSLKNTDDRKYTIEFDEISEKILDSIPEQYKNHIRQQLNQLDDNFMDYIGYWEEKFYRNGFCDGVELISGCLKS